MRFPLLATLLLAPLLAAAAPQVVAFAEVSPYPEVRQDLAFVVDEHLEAPVRDRIEAVSDFAGPDDHSACIDLDVLEVARQLLDGGHAEWRKQRQ